MNQKHKADVQKQENTQTYHVAQCILYDTVCYSLLFMKLYS